MKTQEVIKLLEADGWIRKRDTGGSHVHYVHPIKKGKVTVLVHGNSDLKAGTLSSILRQESICIDKKRGGIK